MATSLSSFAEEKMRSCFEQEITIPNIYGTTECGVFLCSDQGGVLGRCPEGTSAKVWVDVAYAMLLLSRVFLLCVAVVTPFALAAVVANE